jgi:hypothetical protein
MNEREEEVMFSISMSLSEAVDPTRIKRTKTRGGRQAAFYATITAGLILFSARPAAARTCVNGNLKGAYVISLSGFITFAAPPQFVLNSYSPVAVIGTYMFDGEGNAARSLMISAAGQTFPFVDSGTYTVNLDCSGSAVFSTNNETFNFTPFDEESFAIIATAPGEVGTGTLTRQRASECDGRTLSGVYIFNGNGLGTFANPPQAADGFFPVAVMGTWTFDGKGGVRRTLTLDFAGYPGPYDDSGTYQVNGDCTASAYFASDSEVFQLVVIDERRAAFGVTARARNGTGFLLKPQP